MSPTPPPARRKPGGVTIKQEPDTPRSMTMNQSSSGKKSSLSPAVGVTPRPRPKPTAGLSSSTPLQSFARPKPVKSSCLTDSTTISDKGKIHHDKKVDIATDVFLQKQQIALHKAAETKQNILQTQHLQQLKQQKQEQDAQKKKYLKEAEKLRVRLQFPKVKAPGTFDRTGEEIVRGKVRGTPYGAQLQKVSVLANEEGKMTEANQLRYETQKWHKKMEHLPPITFPTEGFGHTYGQTLIDHVDSIHDEKKDGDANFFSIDMNSSDIHNDQHSRLDKYDKDNNEDNDDDSDFGATKAAMAAQFTADKSTMEKSNDGHEYGHEKSPLDAPVKSLKDKWRLLPHFLALRSLLRQHIDSFDYFVSVEMKQIVKSPSACEIRSDHDPYFYLRYENCWVGEPSVEEDSYNTTQATPFQCRLRDCTYSAPIYVDVRYTRGRQIVKNPQVIIGRIPIMLRSSKCLLHNKTERQLATMKECPYDPGGYFVVKGVEKVILIQEQLSKNRVIIEKDAKGYISATITSSTHERKSRCSIFVKKGKIYLNSNTMDKEIPIAIIMKAMGVESDIEIAQMVGSEPEIIDMLALSLEENLKLNVFTQKQALKYVGSKIRGRMNPGLAARKGSWLKKPRSAEDEARDVLATVILSHVPVHDYDYRGKCIYVAHIIRRVVLVSLGKNDLDDKDYYGNKRLELAGNLLSLLFEDLFKRFNSIVKRNADNVLSKRNQAQAFDVIKHLPTDLITTGMIHCISSGNWVLKRFRMDRAGVTQVLSRLSYLSALGMMTRVNSQFEKTQKVSGPRALQPSQWGMLCPADTPEGEACGLVKNLALLAHITTDEEPGPVERLCIDLGVEDVNMLSGNEVNSTGSYLVLLNGLILGSHSRPNQLVRHLRTMRRQGQAGEFVSFYLHSGHKAVYIATDGGRVCRPLIIVDEKTALPKLKQIHIEGLVLKTITIKDLLRQGVVEYVDVNEENNCLIAVTERELEVARNEGLSKRKMAYTHLEVDPLSLLGVVAGIIPNPHHNQSPRNTYQSAMGKQAMGAIAMNEYERMDGLIYTLLYPMKPMVKTRTIDIINFDQVPGGQNACIAVMSYSGYDIEDAVILNKASIDRGFGRCMVLRKHQTSIRRYANGAVDRTLGPPDPSAFMNGEDDFRYQRYKALDKDGICMVGEMLDNGSIMVNKESPVDTSMNIGGSEFGMQQAALSQMEYKPSGLSYRSSAPSYVDKVLITSNEFEHFLVKVCVRQVRRPEVGDKFASRHGQKGVCGLIVPQVDMPFNEFGFPPDLIMNPHGFPSRMTVGKLIELLVGKAGVFEGRQAYASAFGEEFGSTDTASSASEALIRNGINYIGKDLYYSGQSGESLDAYIFSGPVFYQKLKHMVLDKMHARARGPRATLTRQPTEGRSRDGGLRLGEMERDCLIAYGASNLIMERLMHSSDAFSASVCMTCGLIQYENWCQYCRTGEKVADIRLPYACKLLFQELQSMNVLPRLRLQDV